MTTEGDPEQKEEVQEVTPLGSQELVPVETVEPTAPKDLSDEEREEVQRRAVELVAELAGASGAQEMELMDSVTHVGIQAQRSGGAELGLLRRRVGDMLSDDRSGRDMAKNLVNLRMILNRINPDELSKATGIRKVIGVLPLVGRLTPGIKVLQKIAIRYEPVSRQITVIETKLREGRMMLTKDNVELRQLYEQVEAQQLPVQKNAYLGELLMVELQKLLSRTEDPVEAERIRNGLYEVSMRVQNLRTMEHVCSQFFIGINMTRQNNNRLGGAVEQTLSVATNVVVVGLAIQTALSRQRQIMEVTTGVQEFIGDMLEANAAAIKQHTEEIGDVYNKPVIALEKIAQAHQDLLEALDTATRLKQEGIDAARENIAKLSQMSSEMQQRAGALLESAKEPKSIEA